MDIVTHVDLDLKTNLYLNQCMVQELINVTFLKQITRYAYARLSNCLFIFSLCNQFIITKNASTRQSF
jgi:hypothetical protein